MPAIDSPPVAAARLLEDSDFSPADIAAMQKSLLVKPEVQVPRDIWSLFLLEKEKAAGEQPMTAVNKSKNPKKVLWKPGTIDDEMARRRLLLEDALLRSTATSYIPQTSPPTQVQAPSTLDRLSDIFYSSLHNLLSSKTKEPK